MRTSPVRLVSGRRGHDAVNSADQVRQLVMKVEVERAVAAQRGTQIEIPVPGGQ